MAKSATAKKSTPAPQAEASSTTTLTFTLAKETAGALRYEEDGYDQKNMDATFIGTIYLRKAFIEGEDYPKSISVTVNF